MFRFLYLSAYAPAPAPAYAPAPAPAYAAPAAPAYAPPAPAYAAPKPGTFFFRLFNEFFKKEQLTI